MSQKEDKHEDGKGEGERPARDARGRWLKGHCPNPKGRPRKENVERLNPTDMQHFGNTLIELTTNGRKQMMTRREGLYLRIYEDAMKGKAMTQRFLYREFEKIDERLAEAKARLEDLEMTWFIENRRLRDQDITFGMLLVVRISIFSSSFPIS